MLVTNEGRRSGAIGPTLTLADSALRWPRQAVTAVGTVGPAVGMIVWRKKSKPNPKDAIHNTLTPA